MRYKFRQIFFLLLLVFAVFFAETNQLLNKAFAADLSRQIENYSFLDHKGASHELYYYADKKAIVLIWQGNGCPIVRLSYGEVESLRQQFEPSGVKFFYVNANAQDGFDDIAKEARDFQVNIPILKDATQILTTDLNVKRTATAVVIDPREWRIVYQGPIDDRLGYETQKSKAQHRYLHEVLTRFVNDEEIDISATHVKGCLINLNAFEDFPDQITYTDDVAPVLLKKCFICHYDGGVAPFSMENYQAVRGWAPMIKEVIQSKRMPPWKVDPRYGEFKNDLSLSDHDARMIVDWVRGGMLKGEGDDVLKQEQAKNPSRWQLGHPDIILTTQWQDIPATGIVPYLYSLSNETIGKDIWITAVEFKPSNPKVVHHFGVYDVDSDSINEDQLAFEHNPDVFRRYFTGYAPGRNVVRFPEGTGYFIEKNRKLMFMSHYVTTGKKEKNRFEVGLHISKRKDIKPINIKGMHHTYFFGPPNTNNIEVSYASARLAEDIDIYGYYPHMHYHGKSMKFTAQYPDGKEEVLFSVPDYDFHWQHFYYLKNPKKLVKGTKLLFEGVMDNSSANKEIEDPSKVLRWGRGEQDDMFVGSVFYVTRDQQDSRRNIFNDLDKVRRFYYPNGQLKSETYYRNNKKHGDEKKYNEQGELISERHYIHGLLFDNGELFNGIKKTYHDNGAIRSIENFKNGQTDGLSKYFSEEGQIVVEFLFDNGKYLYTNEYDQNGDLLERNSRRYIYPKNQVPVYDEETLSD